MPASTTELITSAPAALLASASANPTATGDLPLFSPSDIASPPFLAVPDPLTTSIHLISSLFFVIALIFGISWLVQKKTGIGQSNFGKVLGILPLGSKRFIYVTDILNRILVLGVTEQQISLLCEITDKATIDALRLSNQSLTTPGLQQLFGFLKRKQSDELTPEDLSRHAENILNNRQRIQDLLLRRRQEQNERHPPS